MIEPTFLRIAVALLLGAASLNALAAERTFVASFGLDTNACTRAAPCRTLQRAHNVTNAGGELIVLDSEGYGRLTINRSISIIAPDSVHAGVPVLPGQQGILINAPSIKVVLRGLTINGQGGVTGVSFSQGSRLVMADCTVKGLSSLGVRISGAVEATLTNLRVEDNGVVGIAVENGANVSVSRSVISGHSQDGFRVQATVGATPTRGVITDSVLSHNGRGIFGFGTVDGAQVRVVAARNQVMNGTTGVGGQGLNCASVICVQVVATDNVVQDMTGSAIAASTGATVVASRNTVTNSAIGLNEPWAGTFISMKDNVSELNTNNTNGTITPGTLR